MAFFVASSLSLVALHISLVSWGRDTSHLEVTDLDKKIKLLILKSGTPQLLVIYVFFFFQIYL